MENPFYFTPKANDTPNPFYRVGPPKHGPNPFFVSTKPKPQKPKKRTRYQKLKRLSGTFTNQDWQHALDYFGNCCAVCGRSFEHGADDYIAAKDHWIPVFVGFIGTTPSNIVPLCHGKGGCNNSKSSKPPRRWLVEKYGQEKGKAIYDRIALFLHQHTRIDLISN